MMIDEVKTRKIILSSPIFKDCWNNPHKKSHEYEAEKCGDGKGSSFYEMCREISSVIPNVHTMINIGVGPGVGMENETIRWLSVYDKIFGPADRFINVDISRSSVENVLEAIKKGKITGRGVNYLSECHVGDVREIDKLGLPLCDLLLWSHGPEHVYREEWESVFQKLSALCHVLVIHLPWGSGYNDEPTHYSPSVRRGELEQFGFKIRYVGVEDTKQANMYGWKLGDR